MAADRELVDALRTALSEQADPSRAIGQQRYMKSRIPYWGLTTPLLRATVRPILEAHPIASRVDWEDTVRALWDEVTHREEWYAAIALARHRHHGAWRDSDAMPLWRHLIETGAWWDVVDDVATHLVREALEREPEVVGHRLRLWAEDHDLWVCRSAIICQVGRRDEVDLELLTATIEPHTGSREFFLRKAIGWALRDVARTHPAWVRRFVATHELSGLSRREALKHLG